MAEVEITGSALDLAERFRQAAGLVRVEGTKALAEIGASVAAAAKAEASKHSSSIPASIKLVPGVDSVEIRAGGPTAPLARIYELGNSKRSRHGKLSFKRNKNAKTGALEFAHPVYATGPRETWAWTTQARYPFLAPARTANRRLMRQRLVGIASESLKPLREFGEE